MLRSLGTKVRTAWALGPMSIARVALYRFGVRGGFHPVRRLRASLPDGPFFQQILTSVQRPAPSRAWTEQAFFFGRHPVDLPFSGPDWHRNPFTGGRFAQHDLPWWEIADFDPAVGDIKTVWEASRFSWVLPMVQRAVLGETGEWERLETWLGHWCRHNPAYVGPNWKCGQEASIRVLHLAMAALVGEQANAPCPALLDLVEVHLRRIAPTVSYALAQNNNHATSEAAALFVGGNWLARAGRADARRWERQGRRLLEKLLPRLVEEDGSFSQYSVNYHRLMLDTMSMVEVWRRFAGCPEFSRPWRQRAAAAARWLLAMVCPVSGDAPNVGANDGAHLLPLTDSGYRDYRPSVQLAMALFADQRAYEQDGAWNRHLSWLGVAVPEEAAPPPASELFDQGGYALLRRPGCMAVLRYPRFRFRPSHADGLHVDLWIAGENHLRDGGSYSYNTDADLLRYFPGTESHNTVQFDERDQMPRVGRFLFGDWSRTSRVFPPRETAAGVEGGAEYRDRHGAVHRRGLVLNDECLVVRDELAGFARKAVLRWRLRPGPWRVEGHSVTNGEQVLTVESDVPVERLTLTTGWESRFYLQKTELPVLEVEVRGPGTLISSYHWEP